MLRPRRPDPVPGRPPRWWRRLRRYRQVLAAALVAVLVLGTVSALRPPAAATSSVVVARADLAPGAVLTDADLVLAERADDALPVDAVRDTAGVVGRLVSSPVRGGEVLRTRDVVGRELLAALGPGLVAVPVRLADDGAAALLHAGDVVDLVSARDDGAAVAAAGVRVLSVPLVGASGNSVLGASAPTSGGSLVVVATDPSSALALHRAEVDGRIGVIWRPS